MRLAHAVLRQRQRAANLRQRHDDDYGLFIAHYFAHHVPGVWSRYCCRSYDEGQRVADLDQSVGAATVSRVHACDPLHGVGIFGHTSSLSSRLTAPYLFMLGVVEVTMKWFAHNAVFEPPALDHETCPHYWWRNLLYINTLFQWRQVCMLWIGNLSDDTQFYAVSAILLILATSQLQIVRLLTGVFFISSLFTTGYVSWSNEHVPNSEDPFTQFDKIYDKPGPGLGPTSSGMATGMDLIQD
ncbi:hypothetical protein evm_003256 [Chilo suppressalis]|nr:hypothetical protein evm_003256 [Chilo suppressalis]